MRFQAPRGTHDVLPQNSWAWQWVEQTFRSHASLYGYQEIRTPMFEEFELFVRSSGETSDVVSKEMYDFEDKGGRHIALKPENTASSIRAYLEHHLGIATQATRLYYIAPIFRYGRPQKGRLRQHHQLGLELIGVSTPEADAEIIEMTVRFYELLGLKGLKVLLNSIGRDSCRAAYREIVLSHFRGYLESLDDEGRAKALKNPLRLLDMKDPSAQELAQTVPSILDYLEPDSRGRFEQLQALLREATIEYEIAPSIVRGLDYYTDTVFEVQSESLGAQSSLCGGGRYDGLVEQLGGPSTPAVGVGMGIERALMVLETEAVVPDSTGSLTYIVAATDSAREAIRTVARSLRTAGKQVIIDLGTKNMKSQLKDADRLHARKVCIIGEDELETGSAIVRDMVSGDQLLVPLERLDASL